MRILYLTWDDVGRPSCGCAQRSAFLYEALKLCGDVDVVRLDHTWEREHFISKVFRKLTKVARWPLGCPCIDLLPRLPKVSGRYDAVVCRYLVTAAIVQAWKIAPCYVDIDDLPSEAFASVEGKRLPGALRPLGTVLVKWWQRHCLRRCAAAWAITEDQAELVRLMGLVRVGVLPNLARRPNDRYRVDAPQEDLLMTVGLMGYEPNQEGVNWFLKNIWPEVHSRWPNLRYAIAGGGLPEGLKNAWIKIPGVEVLGFVDDLDALYEKTLAVVTPILSGAGTCIKVIEAGLHGRVVFATRHALRGQDWLCGAGAAHVFSSSSEFCRCFTDLMSLGSRTSLQYDIIYAVQAKSSFKSFAESVRSVIVK